MVEYNQLFRVFTVRLRYCNASEPTASVSLVAVTLMDVAITYSASDCNACITRD